MKKHSLYTLLAALAFSVFAGGAVLEDDELGPVACGTVGATVSVSAGVKGPGWGSTEEEACQNVEDQLLTDKCKGCAEGVDGCDRDTNWRGVDPPCHANVIPGSDPEIWIANITIVAGGKKGWVSCAQCEATGGGV